MQVQKADFWPKLEFEAGSVFEEVGRHRGNLGGVGRELGAWTDLGPGMVERVLSLEQGRRQLGGEVGVCKVEVILPEVLLHLQQHDRI